MSQLQNGLLISGYGIDQQREMARSEAQALTGMGYTQEQINDHVFKSYGFTFGELNQSANQSDNLLKDIVVRPQGEQEIQLTRDLVKQSLIETDAKVQEQITAQPKPEKSDATKELEKTVELFAQAQQQTLNDIDPIRMVEYLASQGSPKNELDPKLQIASGYWEALRAGFQNSVVGLAVGKPNLAIGPDASFGEKVVSQIGGVLGDLPAFTVGGALGAGAGAAAGAITVAGIGSVPGAILGAGAGAMGFTEALRKALMQHYERGAVTSSEEFVYRMATQSFAGATGASIAAPAMGVGAAAKALWAGAPRAAQIAAPLALEASAFTGLSTMGHAQLPTMEDFALNGITIGGMKLGGFYSSKLRTAYIKSGETPRSMIKLGREEPAAAHELLSGNMGTEGNLVNQGFISLYSVRRNTPISLTAEMGNPRGWMFSRRALADAAADQTNKHNRLSDPNDPKAFGVDQINVAADASVLEIRTTDERTNLIKQYFADVKDRTGVEQPLTPENIDTYWSAMPRGLQNWLQEGRYVPLDSPNGKPIGRVDVLLEGNKMLVMNQDKIMPNEMVQLAQMPIDDAMKAVNKNITRSKKEGASTWSKLNTTYQMVFDRLQPLNNDAPVGQRVVPYLLGRIYSGIDRLSEQWITTGQTGFVKFDIHGKGLDTIRPTTGPAVQDILRRAYNTKVTLAPEEAILAQDILTKLGEETKLSFQEMLKGNGKEVPGAIEELRQTMETEMETWVRDNGPIDNPVYLKTLEEASRARDADLATLREEYATDRETIDLALKGSEERYKIAIEQATYQEKNAARIAKDTAFDGMPFDEVRKLTSEQRAQYIANAESSIKERAAETRARAERNRRDEIKEGKRFSSGIDTEMKLRTNAIQRRYDTAMERFAKDELRYTKEYLAAKKANKDRFEMMTKTLEEATEINWINKGTDDNINLFRAFITAKYAKELHDNNQVTIFDPTAVRTVADSPALNRVFKKASQEIYDLQHALIDYSVAGGWLSAKRGSEVKKAYKYYVPFEYITEFKSTEAQPGYGSSSETPGTTKRIIDPLEAVVQQVFKTMKRTK